MAGTPSAAMSEAMSTVLRLEREIQIENARALSALHQQYQTLSEVVLANARSRGHLGNDPLGAVAALAEPPAEIRVLGEAVISLWRTFFANFRDDEKAFEAARFREKAATIEEWLARWQPGDPVEPRLAIDLLQALQLLWQERHAAISERLDTLIHDLSSHQAQLGSAQLTTAHTADELQRVQHVVHAALAVVNEPPPADEPLAHQIKRLLQRYRADLQSHRRLAGDSVAGMQTLIAAIRDVATRAEPAPDAPALPAPAQAVVDEVRRLDGARRELESIVREMRGHIIGLEGQRRELMEEVAERDRRLARLDHATDAAAVDERLQLYRDAFAALEAGGDHASHLAKVRVLERVISLPADQREQVVKIVDRQLTELARALEDLRKVHPLSEDPRRFRPRFFGSKYDFKAAAGQVQALRDAARDLLMYVERARWAAGVAVLARHVPKLRAVFKELVGLVAAWREKLGDPPPVSITISIDAGSGILALPAILAADLDAILKRRSKAGAACTDLAPLLDEAVARYHQTLVEAKGDAIARTSAPKRESPVQQVARLSTELTALAGACETAFSEAAQSDFRLSEADAALMLDEHLMRLGLTHLDGAVEELAALPNAPAGTFTPLPGRRDASKLILCARERSEWLEHLARYRFQTIAAG